MDFSLNLQRQIVERALHASTAFIQDMRVDHRGGHILMPQ